VESIPKAGSSSTEKQGEEPFSGSCLEIDRPKNCILLIESLHAEILNVPKPEHDERVMTENEITIGINFARKLPGVDFQGQNRKFIDLVFSVDMPTP